MNTYHLPSLERDEEITFCGIPHGEIEKKRDELDNKLRRKLRDNEIRESRSIRFAAGIAGTPSVDDN